MSLTVTPATLRQIIVDPASLSLPVGVQGGLSATGLLSDGSKQAIVPAWSIASGSGIQLSSQGNVTAVAVGDAVVKVDMAGVATTIPVHVSPASLVSFVLDTTRIDALPKGSVARILAFGTYTDGQTRDVADQATWSSSPPQVASAVAGQVTALAPGNCTVTASLGGFTRQFQVVVTPAIVKQLLVTAPRPDLPTTDTYQPYIRPPRFTPTATGST